MERKGDMSIINGLHIDGNMIAYAVLALIILILGFALISVLRAASIMGSEPKVEAGVKGAQADYLKAQKDEEAEEIRLKRELLDCQTRLATINNKLGIFNWAYRILGWFRRYNTKTETA